VATEASAVTFISIPRSGVHGKTTFLQLVMGCMLGRIIVSIIFVPAYFRGDLLTVFPILGVFLLGFFAPTVRQRSAFAGIVAGTAVMVTVKTLTLTSWQWYVLIISVATFAVGVVAGRLLGEGAVREP
jgi:hypothetical protein